MTDRFRQKYEHLSSTDRESVDLMIDYSGSYGSLAAFYASGLARKPEPDRVKKLLTDIYGPEKLNSSKLILLTGSKKPFSDIDLYICSDDIRPVKNSWLDVVVFDEKQFDSRLDLLDVQLTHPVLTGELIAGDKDHLDNLKSKVLQKPITKDAIDFNLKRAQINRSYADNCSDEKERSLSISYFWSYLNNAEKLSRGKRDGLIFTKLKGGNKKCSNLNS